MRDREKTSLLFTGARETDLDSLNAKDSVVRYRSKGIQSEDGNRPPSVLDIHTIVYRMVYEIVVRFG